MKKLITTCALLACASVVSFGQSAKQQPASANMNAAAAQRQQQQARAQMTPEQMKQRQEQMAERQSKFFEKQYGLNPEQYKGVHEANLAFIKNIEELRAQGKQPSREDQEKMMSDRDEAFKKVMTPEQFAKYQATRTKPSSMNANAHQQGAPMQAPAPVKH